MRFRMFRRVMAIVPIVVLGVVALVETRPDRLHVERSARIDAAPDTVFAEIDDLRRQTAWLPWERMDPHMQRAYDGPPAGVGATYHWSGNGQVGEGSARIVESTPGSAVGIALEYVRPFKGSSTATFRLAPDGTGTIVTWALDAKQSFLAKAMALCMGMEEMLGAEFERGLATLKGIAESNGGVR